MNILIPHTWLLDHLDTDATPEEISKYMSLCGPSVEGLIEKEGDTVYNIEVTTNRVDCMSVRGIAREAAVILNQFGKKGKLKPLPEYAQRLIATDTKKNTQQLPLPTIINDENLCKRVIGVALRDVKRNPTPDWMAKRLRQIDANIHDAVIDITNYVTHDLGHPCHAFDYDKLMSFGGMIIITRAEAGKKFVTLDNVEYTTVGGEVVFENDRGVIIDLPGIKGTANTSISDDTKNVLFWIENTEAKLIRFGSMSHAIRTVAAQLNEKNVDPNLATPVLYEGVHLFQELTGAKIANEVYDDFPGQKAPPTVKVKIARITEYLGVELPLNTIDKILRDLECDVALKNQELFVTPPTFRPDIEIAADVIEEIARMYGYHNLPSVVMPTAIPLTKPTDTNFHVENRIKRFLSDIGWQEVYTYSMVSEEVAEQSGYSLAEHLKIQNPLTDDRVYMRRSIIPSLEEVIAQNTQRPELSVFEVANVYIPQENTLPIEELRVSMVSTREFRVVKGELEALLRQFFIQIDEMKIADAPKGPYAQYGTVLTTPKGKKRPVELGRIGVLPNGHVAIVVAMKNLLSVIETHPTYQPSPKTSEVVEALTFILPPQTAVGPVIKELEKISPLIKKVGVKDIYGQNFSFSIVYFDPEKNLTSEEVAPVRKKIVSTMEKKYTAQLVGKLA